MNLGQKVVGTLVKVETRLCTLLVVGIVALIVLNVVTRAIGHAIYWVDELVIYLMIWMVFLTMPLLIHMRKNISITLLTDLLPSRVSLGVALFNDLLVFGLSILFLGFSLDWFSFVELYSHGFDTRSFSASTFNFIYDEPTNTLPINKVFFWGVVPISALLCTFHASCNFMLVIKDMLNHKHVQKESL